ncbi:ATP-dependent 6-phosphofructokinase 5, chloroplastic-like isoform X3 [Actinidia eriantha]|uniref:ATP-dependent 6-phosphofructokinase 5, chloroplastic-like isoform X3 n=1 Tax=Actinidia eriantha TaxID=165200 RepID=UPI00258A0F9F|nr:ATP-dependent 6-phosphofructokinase 5, chloroplastic-like isoform X3 [Actinidia eriantha]
MDSLAAAIAPKLVVPARNSDFSGGRLLGKPLLRPTSNQISKKIRVHAEKTTPIDFGDPDWKSKFQKDFEARFNIPHLTDVFRDAVPIPSTFCLKMRTPTKDFADGYPSDETWHGYINNNDRVLLKVINYSSPTSAGAECIDPDCTWVEQWVHRAGPREKIYFKPEEVKAAIVTCGGLCPGLNDVIRHIVITLEIYGVKKIVGIPYGYRGFSDEDLSEMPLSRKVVQNVHLSGGSLLGVSRGGPSVSDIVDSMEERGINMLFVLGGNGTHAGANAIHNEAHSAYHGIGIVKLMGRSSGFIAMHASLASGQIDICLIPEVPFNLHGPHGVLRHLKYLLETKGSAVVCVAEGAGQTFLQKSNAKDASGNTVLGDIGVYLQQEIKKNFKDIGISADVKYIDPTYMIRACRANASDGILCTVLGQNAVHGAFAGYSGITVGICNTHYVYLPIPEVISYPRVIDPNSRMWHRCLTSTGQPDFI